MGMEAFTVWYQSLVTNWRSSKSSANFVFICGNEATDLDSTACSLMTAFALKEFEGKHLLPFINSDTSSIIRMRGEILLMMRKLGLRIEDLVYFPEVFENASEIDIFLVDHCELTLCWKLQYPDVKVNVKAIIDHHVDIGLFLDASPRIVRTCGSCSTLILEYLEQIGSNSDFIKAILLYPLILDNINFKRTTPMDLKWGSRLLIRADECEEEKLQSLGQPILDELDASTLPEDQFDLFDIFHKDFKLYEQKIRYGISTLRTDLINRLTIEFKNDTEAFVNVVERFMNEKRIGLFLVLVSVRNKYDHYQQMAIFPCKHFDVGMLAQYLIANGTVLRLLREEPFIFYSQENLKMTRKQIQPLVHSFISQLKY